jgi:hypothetical protein
MVNTMLTLLEAWSLGILNSQEKPRVREMISESIKRLRKGSVRPSDFGSRYSQLLDLLWQRTDVSQTSKNSSLSVANMHSGTTPPYMPEDEFSWPDLQAVGEFLSGDQVHTDFDFGLDNVQHYVQASRRGSVSWNDMGWPLDDDMNRFF